VMLNDYEAKTSRLRPRPELQDRGQFLEAEAKAVAKNKYRIMINNIRFKIIAGTINKIPKFHTIFDGKIAQLHNKTTRLRPGRGQMFEAEAKILARRPPWPRGLNITGVSIVD